MAQSWKDGTSRGFSTELRLQKLMRAESGIGLIHLIVASCEHKDWYPPESFYIRISDETLSLLVIDGRRNFHASQVFNAVGADTTEDLTESGMRCFVEVGMVPESSEG